jgi:hypothetical protein
VSLQTKATNFLFYPAKEPSGKMPDGAGNMPALPNKKFAVASKILDDRRK